MPTLKEGFFLTSVFTIILCIIFIVIPCVIFIPFLFIWCLNVFGLAIPYTFKTWFAGLIILVLCRGGYRKS